MYVEWEQQHSLPTYTGKDLQPPWSLSSRPKLPEFVIQVVDDKRLT